MTGRCAARAAVAVRATRDASLVLLVCQLVVAGVAFTINILAARVLGPAGRGQLALLLQVAYLSSLGLLLGCDRSIVSVYAGQSPRAVTRACVRLLRLPFLLALTLFVVLVAVSPRDDWHTSLALALLFAAVNTFVRGVRSVAIATGNYRGYWAYTLVSQALLLVVLALLSLLDVDNPMIWVVGYLLTGATSTALWIMRWLRHGSAASLIPDDGGDVSAVAARVRLARREGLQVLPAAVADSGMLRLDRLLLPALASVSALGIYASVGTMTELIAWPLLALSDSRLGIWRVAYDQHALSLHRCLVYTSAYALGTGVLGVIVLPVLLVPLLGPEYAPAKQLIAPLVLAAAILGVSQLVITALIAIRRNILASAVQIAGFTVSVIAYIVLIPPFGALGAAYGSLVGYGSCLFIAGIVLFTVRCRSAVAAVARGG